MCKCLMRNKHQQCQPLNIRVFECELNRRNSRWMARKHPNHIWDSELLHFTNFVLLLCNSSTYFLLLLFVILFSFYCFCFWSVTSPLSIVLPMTMPVPFVSWFSFNVIACRVCVQSLPTSWTTVMLQFDCCCMLGFFFCVNSVAHDIRGNNTKTTASFSLFYLMAIYLCTDSPNYTDKKTLSLLPFSMSHSRHTWTTDSMLPAFHICIVAQCATAHSLDLFNIKQYQLCGNERRSEKL